METLQYLGLVKLTRRRIKGHKLERSDGSKNKKSNLQNLGAYNNKRSIQQS